MGSWLKVFAFLGVFLMSGSAFAACEMPADNGMVVSFLDAKMKYNPAESAAEGHLIYDAAAKTLKYCDGTSWISFMSDAGGGDASTTGALVASQGFDTPYMRLGFYRFSTGDGSTDSARMWLHLKTNVTMSNLMQTIEFKGYEYRGPLPIDARIAFYAYSASNNILGVGSDGTHSTNVYKSADGYAVVAILLLRYHAGFVLNQYSANPIVMFPVSIMDTKWTTSNTGGY